MIKIINMYTRNEGAWIVSGQGLRYSIGGPNRTLALYSFLGGGDLVQGADIAVKYADYMDMEVSKDYFDHFISTCEEI